MAKKEIKKKKGSVTKEVIGIGASVAALSAAAYMLFGPEGKKNRKIINNWAVKMRGEIIEKFEEAKEITEPVYNQIVDSVKEKYSKTKDINPEDLEKVVKEIKSNWKALKKEISGKPVKKTTAKKSPKSKTPNKK